jgi:glycosyltransferase involved in cell wall biosynthesis
LNNTEPSVSVAICSYTEDRWDDLIEAVQSVEAQTVPACETVVVVDHSDPLLERARNDLPVLAPNTTLRIVANGEQKGLSGARNSAVRNARGQVVAFLDDDARAAPDWIERLCRDYRDPNVVGVGGAVIPDWKGGRPPWFPPEFDWVVGCTHRGVRSDRGPIRNFVGANMSFRRAELERSGGFRSGLGRVGNVPLGCEETELCIRVAGDHDRGVLLYEPTARVKHSVPETRGTWRYFTSRCYAEGLSKAAVSRLTGRAAALQSERHYVRNVLPQGIASSLHEAARGTPSSALRAGAIAAGLTITAVGYLVGRLRQRVERSNLPDREPEKFGSTSTGYLSLPG